MCESNVYITYCPDVVNQCILFYNSTGIDPISGLLHRLKHLVCLPHSRNPSYRVVVLFQTCRREDGIF